MHNFRVNQLYQKEVISKFNDLNNIPFFQIFKISYYKAQLEKISLISISHHEIIKVVFFRNKLIIATHLFNFSEFKGKNNVWIFYCFNSVGNIDHSFAFSFTFYTHKDFFLCIRIKGRRAFIHHKYAALSC